MTVNINGEGKTYEESVSIEKCLEIENVEMPEYVTVVLCGEVVQRDDFSSTVLKDGDSVEFLYYMGGGA